MRSHLIFATTLSLLLALTGCGQASDGSSVPARGLGDGTGAPPPSGPASGDTDGFEGGGGGVPGGGGGSAGGEGCAEDGCDGIDVVPAGQLTAGEWRDLDNWEFWLELSGGEAFGGMHDHWGYETTARVPVSVVSDGEAVIDAHVELLDGDGAVVWQARSDSQGRAELFASAFTDDSGPYSVRATSGDATVTVADVSTTWMSTVEVDLPSSAGLATPALDLMFVVDTTGSMGDELWYIQAELEDVIQRARDESAQVFDLRLSMNFYRDTGDAYVVNSHPFTTNVADGLSQLMGESANGGGDFPEAVDQALADAIDSHEWRDNATARLLFLVLDAPPHHDQAILETLRDANRAAAAHGVKIIPVAGSGIDKNTEFLMRMLAVTTGGTYTFLTNHSGIGGDHIDPSIGRYKVWFLNDLLVDIITDEISPSTAD